MSWSPAREDGGRDSGDKGSKADRGETGPTMGETEMDMGDRTGEAGVGKGGDKGCRSDVSPTGEFLVLGAGSEMFLGIIDGTGDGAGDVVRAEMRRRAWRGSFFQRPRSAEVRKNVTRVSGKKLSCSSSSLSVRNESSCVGSGSEYSDGSYSEVEGCSASLAKRERKLGRE
jgi:hypothetical protein